jgi:hypothetical protein
MCGQFHQYFMSAFAPLFLRQKIKPRKYKRNKVLRKTFARESRRFFVQLNLCTTTTLGTPNLCLSLNGVKGKLYVIKI